MRLAVLLLLAVLPPAAAEDWTVDGRDYHDVKAGAVENGSVSITYAGGIGRVALADLPPDLQKRFGYTKSVPPMPVNDSSATATGSSSPPVMADSTDDAAAINQINAMSSDITTSMNAIAGKGGFKNDEAWIAVSKKIDALQILASSHASIAANPQTVAMILSMRKEQFLLCDFLRWPIMQERALLNSWQTNPMPEVVSLARELEPKPLDLKFTALDGREVDFSKMRGKVVLVDFWATWCGPCREEMPNVVAAYAKYHPQGVEFVGISLDKQADMLSQFVAANGMAWPQYYEGKAWDNSMATRFKIHLIPTLWLVDKSGAVVSEIGGNAIDSMVQKALAAP